MPLGCLSGLAQLATLWGLCTMVLSASGSCFEVALDASARERAGLGRRVSAGAERFAAQPTLRASGSDS